MLAFPVPFPYLQSAMTWQAVDGLHYSMVGGGGPDAIPERAGKDGRPDLYRGFVLLRESHDHHTGRHLRGSPGSGRMGVTMVVVPDTAHLPTYEQLHDVKSIAGVITAATGRGPSVRPGRGYGRESNRPGPPVRGRPPDSSPLCGREHSRKFDGRRQIAPRPAPRLAGGAAENSSGLPREPQPSSPPVSLLGRGPRWRAEPPRPSATGKERITALDGLRGVAVLIIMGYHFGVGWLQGGFFSLDIFYVLSGYLITGLLVSEYRKRSASSCRPSGCVGLGGSCLRWSSCWWR